MRIPFNDLRRRGPTHDLEREVVRQVLDSGWYVHGPQHDGFESELATYLGVANAVGVGSGTDALELVLTAVARPGRDVVVTAANAGGYTSVAARRSGLRVRFADVLPDTLCLDASTVEPRLTPDVAAVVVTHLYGRLTDPTPLQALCLSAGVPLVEDCAQAFGANLAGRRAGSFGTASTFSFYPTKNLGAVGDGGAVATDDDELALALKRLRQYGWSRKYAIDVPAGRNSRLDELQAAVLRLRLPHVDMANMRRRAIIARYASVDASGVRVLPAKGAEHSGHLAVALCEDREAVQDAFARAGIGTDVHYPVPDQRQTALADQHDGSALPVTDATAARTLSLPCYPGMTDDEVEVVCGVLAHL